MRVFVDTGPLIYLLEGTAGRREAVRERIAVWLGEGATLGASVLTLSELLVPLKKAGRFHDAARYRSALGGLLGGPLRTIDEPVADYAAELRARYRFRTPDALQLACAVCDGYDDFFTNDRDLRRCRDVNVVLVDAP